MLGKFNGIDIIGSVLIQDKQPKITLSNKVSVSHEFRVKCDAFYLEFFGEEIVAYMFNDKMFMSAKNVAILKSHNLRRLNSKDDI